MRLLPFLLLLPTLALAQGPAQPRPAADPNARAEALLSRMTLEEKVGQMTQITLDVLGAGGGRYESTEPLALDPAEVKKALVDYHVGSVLNTANNRARTPEVWNRLVQQLQDVATRQTRLRVPIIYGIDAIHGSSYTVGATLFPQAIGQAASRNRGLVRRMAEISAYETRASSLPWTFAPVLDLGADPRSPRHWETLGEDPYLAAELGRQLVKGYEGETNALDAQHVAANLKHFFGYQVPVSGKDRTNSVLSVEQIYEYHLPAFRAAVQAGTHTAMLNSGLINGVPLHSSRAFVTGLLKEQLGFEGLVVTDWQDIENLCKRDHLAATDKEAIKLGINAGIDMSMVPYDYEKFCDNLVALVREGQVPPARIDDAVRRVLRVKLALGLFERPTTRRRDYPLFGSAAHARAAYELAAESITLLKNQNHVLPLKKGTRLLVAGPNAHSMRTLNGAWSYSWQGEKVEDFAGQYHTILEAMQQEFGPQNVQYVPGVSYNFRPDGKYYDEMADQLDAAVAAAANADVVLLCLGENTYVEKPGDLNDLYLGDRQTELAQRLIATGKPVVLVLNEGRPRLISRFEAGLRAVVQAYLPGNYGGDALADVLSGDVNPSGKLPYTYPRYPNTLVGYIHKYAEEQKKAEGVYNYEADFNPQFAFGTGLSYTTFQYSNLRLSQPRVPATGQLTVQVDLQNTGPRPGHETAHLFSSDLVASLVAPDVRRLRRFEKVLLQPGETRTLTFTLPVGELAYSAPDGRPTLEPGEFELEVGGQKARFVVE